MTQPGTAWSVALAGMHGVLVEVEVALANGLPRTAIIGLPDSALYEARDRCKAAITSLGIVWPSQVVTINLTPANMPKGGSHYDLAILAATLAAADHVPKERTHEMMMLGEVGLDGRVRQVRGLLPALMVARTTGFTAAVVPACQSQEAQLVEGLTIWPVATVADVVEVLHGRPPLDIPTSPSPVEVPAKDHHLDFADVIGQPDATFALEVAAAGRHHIYLHGPPGVGKTMLAERLPSILPPLSADEAMEVAAVRSLAGWNLPSGLDQTPPFSAPHHSATMVALVGGGQRLAKPGAVSLAHRGVLFLDEAPEFGQTVLDSLRTPLESGRVTISRAAGEAEFPARFQLVLAANPCPCGQAGNPQGNCRCTPNSIRRYAERLSGPILDRIDIQFKLRAPNRALLVARRDQAETSDAIKTRVVQARDRQARRLHGTPWQTNGEVPGPYLRSTLPLPNAMADIDRAFVRGILSSRGVDKVLRLSWTLADLGGRDIPEACDVAGALAMRRGGELGAVA